MTLLKRVLYWEAAALALLGALLIAVPGVVFVDLLGQAAPAEGAWMGLSEITAQGDWVYIVERDNQIADKAVVKRLYRVKAADMKPAKLGAALPVVAKELVHDFLPDLQAQNGYVVDKIEATETGPGDKPVQDAKIESLTIS